MPSLLNFNTTISLLMIPLRCANYLLITSVLCNTFKVWWGLCLLLQWFQSYLSGCILLLSSKFASCLSDSVVQVISGVPPGFLFSQVLFSLFMNDIGKLLDCKYVLFADNVQFNIYLFVYLCKNYNRLIYKKMKCVTFLYTWP